MLVFFPSNLHCNGQSSLKNCKFNVCIFLSLHKYDVKFAIDNVYAYVKVIMNLKTDKYIINNECKIAMDT
jgi:hypothetical protein